MVRFEVVQGDVWEGERLITAQLPARVTGSISSHAKARLEPSARIGFLVRQIHGEAYDAKGTA